MKRQNDLDYPVIIEPLPAGEGGGFAAIVPDLPGCMSNGDTPEQALFNVKDAIACWTDADRARGRDVPRPSTRLPAAI